MNCRHCLNRGSRPALVVFLESLGLFPLEALFPAPHYAGLRFLLPARFLSVRLALLPLHVANSVPNSKSFVFNGPLHFTMTQSVKSDKNWCQKMSLGDTIRHVSSPLDTVALSELRQMAKVH